MPMSRICMIGGAGFIGRHVAERLVRDQHTLVIPTRRRERAKADLITLPTVDLVQADVHDDATLDHLFVRCDVVINLAGTLHSRTAYPYGPQFASTHVELVKRIVAACGRQGVPRLIQMSALGARPDASSEYLRSKGDGEAVALAAPLAVTVFQPSVVFGPGDSFLNLFAQLQRALPVMLLGMPAAKLQPVYVDDVARAVAASVVDEAAAGQNDSHADPPVHPGVHPHVYPLVGPRVYTLRELVRYAGEQAGCARPIIGLGRGMALMQARVLELLPGRLMSRDNVRSLQTDSVSSVPLPFGITATPLEAVAPGYLAGGSPRTRYDRYRRRAGRAFE